MILANQPIPVVGPAYKNRELPLSAQVSKNLWLEINPEARSPIALHAIPGLNGFGYVGGVDRGMHVFNGSLYGVMGTTFYSMDSEGRHTNLGTVAGSDRCVFADDGTQIVIVNGANPYIYTVADGLTEIDEPNLTNPTSVAYINTQFILDNNRGIPGEFVTSEVTATFSVNALDFATAESHPDDIVRVLTFNQYVYFFGTKSIEPWYNSGVGSPPFARVNGGIRPYGLAGTHAAAATSEFIYFLDEKRIPRRMSQFDPVSIGTPPMGVEWGGYDTISDVIVQPYTQDHQQFVMFTFPTANRTWVFHEQTNSWFQMADGVGNDRHKINSIAHVYGLNIVADYENGQVYDWDACTHTNAGKAQQRQRDTATIHGGLYGVPGKMLFFDQVEFIFAIGDCKTAGLGGGAIKDPVITGLCGSVGNLTQGDPIGPTPLMRGQNNYINEADPVGNSVSIDDTRVVSFTLAFTRDAVGQDSNSRNYAIQFWNQNTNDHTFGVYIDGSGYLIVSGKNQAGTEILKTTITNNGASFADSALHFITFVADLTDSTRREIYHNNLNITANTAWVTWDTYTNDLIALEDLGTSTAQDMKYNFGYGETDNQPWDSGTTDINNTLGFICFDNTCSLIGGAVWDENDWVRDPGKWEGWFLTRPKVAYLPSFWRNTGSTEPATEGANALENRFWVGAGDNHIYGVDTDTSWPNHTLQAAIVNVGIAGTTESTDVSSLPAAASGNVELSTPHWNNLSQGMDANWVNLNDYTVVDFAAHFGSDIDAQQSFEQTKSANLAIRVSTTDAGNELSLPRRAVDYENGALVLIDASGTIQDWVFRVSDFTAGGNIVIPADGNTYYIIASSDTDNLRYRMWDSS